MGRPREVTDDKILRATTLELAASGPYALTLEAVARRVGLTAPALSKRFGSRRALLLATVRSGVDDASAAFDAAREDADSPLDALVDGLAANAASQNTRRAIANGLAFLQIDMTDDDFRSLAQDHFAIMRKQMKALLDEAVAQRALAPTDTLALARLLEVVYNGSLISWAIHGDGPVESAVRRDARRALAPYVLT